ncbi:phosphatidylglycerophosphatase B [Erwinia sp. OLTSP20]|uniref:phosphatidylglycerophosphatase B n=1 Tax=unclassified Erwinia TaxID=2622719 RepID=UPI000C182D9D|nr:MULTISPECIES: phosphatidylglycerophosphatase B [unclassified Erwinia]PIJ51798.1 phosphatidylglycerophosphatase B [Erwinia sp. OAMSP11]PIJ74387.1 phosphatidylglycerophosphatase B [Erwinia sp. OLSSP12]PIJ83780.1 phosphatidylglycerophosphatase B [Erwinia sp. OLCASP19]PIJ86823.1 phosphatidylglycerophosphatase B [Erwinia sp. OLMTSP26]PIJ88230.1 phosphatidylglycerophosphatase B [Erwinia sp. OLMDSP33]
MAEIVKRTGFGALILIMMPLLVWLSGWQWTPGGNSAWLYALYGLTESVTRPWGILTSAVLSGWFLWCLRFRLRPALVLLLIMLAAITCGQYSNHAIKALVKEPRPYVLWLEQVYQVNNSDFYGQSRQARSQQVTRLIAQDNRIPHWLKPHWAFETGYAFPSGHSVFAVSWALLSVGLLWPRRHYKTIVVMMLWASGVMCSRLVLGMHWPRDLAAAVLVSWLLVMLASWCALRWSGSLSPPAQEQREITRRQNPH